MENKLEDQNSNQLNPKKQGLAIASLICGIIGTVPALSTVSIVAIICGHIALIKIKKNSNKYAGKNMAIAGLILGYIGLTLAIILGIMNGFAKMKLKGLGY
jgi:flagellar biosynthesis component FlhA